MQPATSASSVQPAAKSKYASLPWVVAAFMWGSAEGAFFFIVVDVLLTYIAIRHGLRWALWCALAATFGALEGGVVLFLLSRYYPTVVDNLLASVPAISPDMVDAARQAMKDGPAWALLTAGFVGMPYKLFAAAAPHASMTLGLFMLVSFPVRLLRFALSAFAAAAVKRMLAGALDTRWLTRLWLAFWIIFYALYWTLAAT